MCANNGGGCDYKNGPLPSCAPLAISYTPAQTSAAPQYGKSDALARGTLFPGLDLPLKNIANRIGAPDTPLGELMSLDFVIAELGLYLDTHPCDTEALKLYRNFETMCKEAKEKYVELYGPLEQTQVSERSYNWLESPWPWEYVKEA